MRKGSKVKHTKGCMNSKCRGKCVGQQKIINQKRILEQQKFIDSTPPYSINELYVNYNRKKQEVIKTVDEKRWNTLGKIFGYIYSEGDDALAAFLDGFYESMKKYE